MALTPEDVRNKRFTPVRLREGYDMGEVDQFLDEVETELERMTEDAKPGTAPQRVGESPEPESDSESEPGAAPVVVAPPPTVGEASSVAARLLEIAARNADEVVTDATARADTITSEARTTAQRLDKESKTKADRMESDARVRAEKLDAETAAKRQQLVGDLERERATLSGQVEQLQVFEREYRDRLRNYFQAQLAQLADEQAAPVTLPGGQDDVDEHTPRRLRSLFGEEQSRQT